MPCYFYNITGGFSTFVMKQTATRLFAARYFADLSEGRGSSTRFVVLHIFIAYFRHLLII
jgi:hypothetical protein